MCNAAHANSQNVFLNALSSFYCNHMYITFENNSRQQCYTAQNVNAWHICIEIRSGFWSKASTEAAALIIICSHTRALQSFIQAAYFARAHTHTFGECECFIRRARGSISNIVAAELANYSQSAACKFVQTKRKCARPNLSHNVREMIMIMALKRLLDGNKTGSAA